MVCETYIFPHVCFGDDAKSFTWTYIILLFSLFLIEVFLHVSAFTDLSEHHLPHFYLNLTMAISSVLSMVPVAALS